MTLGFKTEKTMENKDYFADSTNLQKPQIALPTTYKSSPNLIIGFTFLKPGMIQVIQNLTTCIIHDFDFIEEVVTQNYNEFSEMFVFTKTISFKCNIDTLNNREKHFLNEFLIEVRKYGCTINGINCEVEFELTAQGYHVFTITFEIPKQ